MEYRLYLSPGMKLQVEVAVMKMGLYNLQSIVKLEEHQPPGHFKTGVSSVIVSSR